jgi:hypothetical protein
MYKLLEKDSALREERLSCSSKHEFFCVVFLLHTLFFFLYWVVSVTGSDSCQSKLPFFFFFRVIGDFEQLLNFEEICSNLGDR